MTHTPGPWSIDKCPDANGFATVRVADGSEHGDLDAPVIATVYAEPHATLIAAAPQMLAALKAADAWVCQYFELPGHEPAANAMSRVLRAAIWKAGDAA